MKRDNDFIKKHGLLEAVRRFQQINEYSFISGLTEDDDEQQGPDQQGGQQPPMGGEDPGMGAGPQQGADPGMMPPPQQQGPGMPDAGAPAGPDQGMPPMGGGPAGPGPDQQGGQQPPMGGEDPGTGGPAGPEPMGEMPPEGDIEDIDMEGDGEDEEVIDVDELTDSQEATEYKVDSVNSKLTKLLDVIKDYQSQIDKSNEQIADLKAEFARRNPTPEEKLNIRSQASYPYSETPKDFWERKTDENPHYDVISDNEVSPADEQKRFEITSADVDGFDMKSISDSFDEPIRLDKFFNF